MPRLKRALSIEDLYKMSFKQMELDGNWAKSLGTVLEMSGVWIIWANSGNGKTRFALQLAKMLTRFGKVAYNTLEEGARMTFQRAAIATNLREVARRMLILNREDMEALKKRLSRPKSPDIIIIDSFQYSGLTKRDYIRLKADFPNKLFIFISHAEGKHPEGRPAKFVRYDADIKIRVEGYKAFPVSRYGGGEPFTIWETGAKDYWQEIE